MKPTTVTFDLETHTSDKLWDMPPDEFFRLGGYAWGDDDVQLTDDRDEMLYVLRRAEKVIGHNVHAFDLTALFGKDSIEPLQMALDGKIFDTWADAPVIEPYPVIYTNRHGVQKFIDGVRAAMAFYGLAEMAHRWGTTSKIMDLADLATEFGDPTLRGRERTNDGFGKIPVDDRRFRDYLIGDVRASRELAEAMLSRHPWTPYRAREQRFHGVLAQCARNGLRIDVEVANERRALLNERKRLHMDMLIERYGMPTQGKMPLRTKEGKAAVLAALAEVGVDESDLPRTKTGKNPALGGKEIQATVAAVNAKRPGDPRNDEAESLANSLAAISGARMTVETFLNNMHSDGRCHPSITALQRSARISFHDPGLTVMGNRGDGRNDKAIIIAREGHQLVEFDFQAADTRAVCAYSGDEVFLEEFVKGDAHTVTANAVWGPMPPGPDGKHPMRDRFAKPANHASAYRVGARKLHLTTGMSMTDAKKFLDNQKKRYRKRFMWQERTTEFGKLHGYVLNDWGRKLPVDRDRAYTQSTAQLGQNATREMLVDILLSIPMEISRWLVGIIHDAALFDWPTDKVDAYSEIVMAAAKPFSPAGGIEVDFPFVAGHPGRSWLDASH